jgi:hypothetical protein
MDCWRINGSLKKLLKKMKIREKLDDEEQKKMDFPDGHSYRFFKVGSICFSSR